MGGAMPGMASIVASRTLKPADCPGATVIGDGLADRVRELRAGAGKDIWLFGGGSLFRSVLDARFGGPGRGRGHPDPAR